MYKIVAFISYFVRQNCMPNPFGTDLNAWLMDLLGMSAILHVFTFGIVGLFYEEGSAPVLGSLLYLFFYSVHMGLLVLMGNFGWTMPAIIIILGLYLLVILGIKLGFNRLSGAII